VRVHLAEVRADPRTGVRRRHPRLGLLSVPRNARFSVPRNARFSVLRRLMQRLPLLPGAVAAVIPASLVLTLLLRRRPVLLGPRP
jgi:hypothetical protein